MFTLIDSDIEIAKKIITSQSFEPRFHPQNERKMKVEGIFFLVLFARMHFFPLLCISFKTKFTWGR